MKNRFFSRTDWAAFLTGAAGSFLLYFFTCAPTVTLEDCGELAVAGDYAGVPHPPGYPSWTACAWVFSRLLSWVSFRGQPNPAWAIAVMSAFWGALAVGIMAMLVSRTSADLLSFRARCSEGGPAASRKARDPATIGLVSWAAGSAGALAFAFCPAMWSQSVIVEVYSFNAFFFMLVLLLVYRWMRRPSNAVLVATAFLFGLGLTNYQVLFLVLVPLVAVILLQDIALFRDFLLVGVPIALGLGMMQLGSEPSRPGFEKHVPLSPSGISQFSMSALRSVAQSDDLPTGGVCDLYEGEWALALVPTDPGYGQPSGGTDKNGRPWGALVTGPDGKTPLVFRGKDGTPYVMPLFHFATPVFPASTDGDELERRVDEKLRAYYRSMDGVGEKDVERLLKAARAARLSGGVRLGSLLPADRKKADERKAAGEEVPTSFGTAEDRRSAAVRTGLVHGFTIALALAFAGAACYLGILDRRRRRDGKPLDPRRAIPAFAALTVAGIALFFLCTFAVPSPPPYPWTEEDLAAAGGDFSWFLPTGSFAAGIALLFVAGCFAPGGVWYAAGATGILFPMAVFLRRGALPGLVHPLNPYFLVFLGAGAAILVLGALLLDRGRLVALAFLAGAAGLAFYLYMPVSGDFCEPMNWGYPRTWEGFKHATGRKQYEEITFDPSAIFSKNLVSNVGYFFSNVRMQFTLLLAPFAFVPFAAVRVRAGRRRAVDLLPFAVWCSLAIAAIIAFDRVCRAVDLEKLRVDKLFFALLLAAAAVGLHAVFVRAFLPLLRVPFDREKPLSDRILSGLMGVGAFLAMALFALGVANAVAEFALDRLGVAEPVPPIADPDDPEAVSAWLAGLPSMAEFVAAKAKLADWESADRAFFWKDLLLTGAFFLAWLVPAGFLVRDLWKHPEGERGEPPREDAAPPLVDPVAPPEGVRWHVVTTVCFLVMSFLLIALAQPKGDVQDEFIQKVKFIAAHGTYALWIGYGLALALRYLADFFRRRLPKAAPALSCAALAAVVAVPLVPVRENYANFRLADVTSGSDQNGHDFGWQFGNYQLRGAPAISEELSEEEEPLPNPLFPPPMTKDAVFFGGTDPGRFVPTYMIYSAMVRPDVYLITQNALADKTYLDTMRVIPRVGEGVDGAYGDQIWMPTSADNERAFGEYFAKNRNAGRGVDGRLEVKGALEVMQINAIIAKDIFLRNRDRHDFYVEESYPMEWMYPYIVPNGLIMKIARDETGPWSDDTVRRDMDFWDWYVRRLSADPKFGRDLPARKAFCKLRSALAGAYVNRARRNSPADPRFARLLGCAGRAYREALALYVYSPETVVKLSWDVLYSNRTEYEFRQAENRFLQHPDESAARMRELVSSGSWPDAMTGPIDLLQTLDPRRDPAQTQGFRNLRSAIHEAVDLADLLVTDPVKNPIPSEELLARATNALAHGFGTLPYGAARRMIGYVAPGDRKAVDSIVELVSALVRANPQGAPFYARMLLAGTTERRTPGGPPLVVPELRPKQLAAIARICSAGGDHARSADFYRRYLQRPDGAKDWFAWFDYAEELLDLSDPQKAGKEGASEAASRENLRLATLALDQALRLGGDPAKRALGNRPALEALHKASSAAAPNPGSAFKLLDGLAF